MTTESIILLVALVFVLVFVLFVGFVLFGQYKLSPKNIKEVKVIKSKNNKIHFEPIKSSGNSEEEQETRKLGIDNIVHWNEKIMMEFISKHGGDKTAENVSDSLIEKISEILEPALVSDADRVDVFCSTIVSSILMSNSSFDSDDFIFYIPMKNTSTIVANLDISSTDETTIDVFLNKKFIGSILLS